MEVPFSPERSIGAEDTEIWIPELSGPTRAADAVLQAVKAVQPPLADMTKTVFPKGGGSTAAKKRLAFRFITFAGGVTLTVMIWPVIGPVGVPVATGATRIVGMGGACVIADAAALCAEQFLAASQADTA